MAKAKIVSIRDDQEKWLQDNNISLSKLVQKAIDKTINKEEVIQ